MKRSAVVRKLACSFFGEFVSRCLLLALCAICIWRLTKSSPHFPHWGYALLGIGIFLSICDCLQALWYKLHLRGYWHFYKYMHWRGRTWFDPNTLFCLLTVVPALGLTELAIYNYNAIHNPTNHHTTVSSAQNVFDLTTSNSANDVTSSIDLLTMNSNTTTDQVSSSGIFETTTTETAEAKKLASTNTDLTTAIFSTPDFTSTNNSFIPVPTDIWAREWSLLLLHHVTCLLLVLVRVQIRRPESLQRIQLNMVAFELLLHALDTDNLVVTGLSEEVVREEYALFVGVMVLWGIGFVCLIFILSRRHETDLLPSDRKKLETFYVCVILILQELPRLGLRLAIVIESTWPRVADTYTMLFGLKNLLAVFLYSNLLYVIWGQDTYAARYG